MQSYTGPRLSYRSLQAISDLQAVAGLAGDDTIRRIAAGSDLRDDDIRALIQMRGARLTTARDAALHRGLVLAATLAEDRSLFGTATAILLADRLQGGLGGDDLFWHWDGFRDAYRDLPPAIRAAIHHGFLRLHADRRVSLLDQPAGEALVTKTRPAVIGALSPFAGDSVAAEYAEPILAVLYGRAPVLTASEIWTDMSGDVLRLTGAPRAAILAGLRHLYEARQDYDPFRDRSFPFAAPRPPLLPFAT